jgi:hypothetical protein
MAPRDGTKVNAKVIEYAHLFQTVAKKYHQKYQQWINLFGPSHSFKFTNRGAA